eukprot:365309-Chlamydomonas_euryale.AAC.19
MARTKRPLAECQVMMYICIHVNNCVDGVGSTCQVPVPICPVRRDIRSEHVLQTPVDSLRLAISLRMIGCGYAELHASLLM